MKIILALFLMLTSLSALSCAQEGEKTRVESASHAKSRGKSFSDDGRSNAPKPSLPSNDRSVKKTIDIPSAGMKVFLQCVGSSIERRAVEKYSDCVVSVFDNEDKEFFSATVGIFFVAQDREIFRGESSRIPRPVKNSIVISDFNFDEEEDVALWTDNQGSYGSPSYSIYLSKKDGEGLFYDDKYSDLTIGSLDFPIFDNGFVTTSYKEGCCFHGTDVYQIKDGKPVLFKRDTEETSESGEIIKKSEKFDH